MRRITRRTEPPETPVSSTPSVTRDGLVGYQFVTRRITWRTKPPETPIPSAPSVTPTDSSGYLFIMRRITWRTTPPETRLEHTVRDTRRTHPVTYFSCAA